jgi:hypothetical protein
MGANGNRDLLGTLYREARRHERWAAGGHRPLCVEYEAAGAAIAEARAEGRRLPITLVEAAAYLDQCPICREVIAATAADLQGVVNPVAASPTVWDVLASLFDRFQEAGRSLVAFQMPAPAMALRGSEGRGVEVHICAGQRVELALRGQERPGYVTVYLRAPSSGGGPEWSLVFPAAAGDQAADPEHSRIAADQEIRLSYQESADSLPGPRQVVCLWSEGPIPTPERFRTGAGVPDEDAIASLRGLSESDRQVVLCEVLAYSLSAT